ncbi:aspartate aminotransferase family protein [soil metagenome]
MAGPATYFNPDNTSGLDAATRDLVERRSRVLGSAYRLFYDDPVQLVRGEGTKVYDANGVEYLDAYNNVPSVGHAHPRVTAAMTKQAGLLTTHTRYLSEGIVSYAEDLLSTLPESIDNIMFTCTGSEANDLALRIAKLVTGGTGVIVSLNAYHGVTTEIAAISPSLGGIESVAEWTRVVRAPGTEVDFGEAVEATVSELEAFGIRPAALIVDTVFASDGVYPEVPGLARAIKAVRKAGGLFIADEVQPGFGRLGHGMWGFERYGVVPDLVTVGKPMGNGQPIAAVMAPHGLIDKFNERSRYFNTFGGSSVSIAAAQATLDVLRDEQLIENARDVGAYLLKELRRLPFLEVRGAGLFIGAQLESAERAVKAVNDLRERRVLLSAAGLGNDSLKIRPPLPFSRADADRLLTELEYVLQ